MGSVRAHEPLRATDPATRLLAWSQAVERSRFVDKARARLLERLDIRRIGELLYHLPFRYLDLTHTASLGTVRLGEATVIGRVFEVTTRKVRKQLTITEVTLTDGTGTLIGVWFNQSWVEQSFHTGQLVAFSGEIKLQYGLKQIVQPFVEKLGGGEGGGESVHAGRILPVHRSTEGLSVGWLRRLIAAAVDDYAAVSEYLPLDLLARRQLPPYAWALRTVHFPSTLDDADVARRRLAYGELFDLQLLIARRRHVATVGQQGTQHVVHGPAHAKLAATIPFTLTADQEHALSEILADMAGEHPMQRLLLGDVGTGKTLVAAFALAAVADTGTQAAMMAPTEILAQQYAKKLGPLFDEVGITWVLLTGSTPSDERRQILERLQSGEISIVFGTHALLEDDVAFQAATLVIVDEQHRFGVAQRKALHSKGAAPDVLVMSATPIPRTLTLVAYGDLATSYLRVRPVKGAGITTKRIKFAGISKAWDAIHKAVAAGQQAYVVCALVDESSKIEAQSAQRMVEELAASEFKDLRVELLTGKMRPAAKNKLMDAFRTGAIDVVVATTVIEVGVDVPNATAMVVLDADRYGLAQLHQLRGRVGRGALPGEVWLVSDSFSREAQERFAALLETDDGFRLAELDLRQRGAGELLGHKQSGMAEFRAADLVRDAELAQAARSDAFKLLAADPLLAAPELALLKARISALEEKLGDWEAAG